MTNNELIFQTEVAVKAEKNATAEVVRLFSEINARKLYLEMGFSSLYAMATEYFGLCTQSAYLRINAMKLINAVPEVEAKILNGELSLTVAANIQSFVSREKSVDVHELIETCAGKSVREVEREFARINPEIDKREVVRQTTEDRVRVSHGSSNRLEEKLEKIRQAWSHKNPNMSREELLEMMADKILKDLLPKEPRKSKEPRLSKQPTDSQKTQTSEMSTAERVDAAAPATEAPATEAPVTEAPVTEAPVTEAPVTEARCPAQVNEAPAAEARRTRYIPRRVRYEVIKRNAGQGCEYRSHDGRRCGSHHQMQFDHIEPYSLGGENTVENLRMYCAQHNRARN